MDQSQHIFSMSCNVSNFKLFFLTYSLTLWCGNQYLGIILITTILNLCYVGVDFLGRPVIVFVGRHFQARSVDLNKVCSCIL